MAKAAPVLVEMMTKWCDLGGQNFGIVGDGNHGYGFHRAANEIGPDDYSRRRDPNGPNGPYVDWDYACAGDYAHNYNSELMARHAELLNRLTHGDPDLRSVCEFIGKPYANQPVLYWCRWTGEVSVYTGSGHDRWSHVSVYRSMADIAPVDPWRLPGGGSPTPVPDHPGWPGRYITQPPIMRGDDVRTWQGRMRERGWSISVDGAYGPKSETVCRLFQGEKGLTVDGVVGPVTWNAAWESPIT